MMRAVPFCWVALALFQAGCVGGAVGGEQDETHDNFGTFSATRPVGKALQRAVLRRAAGLARQNRPYIFNGVQDCYGYIRQVWNAILHDGSAHPEDFYPKAYNRRRWLSVARGLPVADAPSSKWAYFSSPSQLLPGDVLATHKGHAWGSRWHGGIYAGKTSAGHRQWDNTTYNGNGAFNRPLYRGFHYYYRPTHELLARGGNLAPPPAATYQWIVSRHSGKCLEASSGANAAKVWQATCKDTAAQKWKPQATGSGRYRFVSALGGRCLDIPGGSKKKATALSLWDCNNASPQSFKLVGTSGAYVTLVAQCSSQCIDVGGWSRQDEAQVIQWTCHGGNNQQWRLSPVVPTDVRCPPTKTTAAHPPSLGDLAGLSCSYSCWGRGSLYNRCGAGRWQFCLPKGAFAACENM